MFGKQNLKEFTLILRKRKSTAFTLIELLVVVAIIALLVSIMVPAVQNAMNTARDGVVGTQLHNIEIGLEMFKHDTVAGAGYYSQSADSDQPLKSGAELLCDYLMGLDLKGFDPEYDPASGLGTFDPTNPRRGPFIKLGTVEFVEYLPDPNDARDYLEYIMLCKWGFPILYYRAAPGTTLTNDIGDVYDAEDNAQFIIDYTLRGSLPGTDPDPLADPQPANAYDFFYEEYIWDPAIGDPGYTAHRHR